MNLNISPASAMPSVTSFKASALDKVSSEQLSSPGKYSQSDLYAPALFPEKKKGSFLGFLAKTVVTLLVLGGAIVGGRKMLMKDYVIAEKAPEGFGKQAKHYFAKTADWINNKIFSPVLNIFKKKDKATGEASTEAKETINNIGNNKTVITQPDGTSKIVPTTPPSLLREGD